MGRMSFRVHSLSTPTQLKAIMDSEDSVYSLILLIEKKTSFPTRGLRIFHRGCQIQGPETLGACGIETDSIVTFDSDVTLCVWDLDKGATCRITQLRNDKVVLLKKNLERWMGHPAPAIQMCMRNSEADDHKSLGYYRVHEDETVFVSRTRMVTMDTAVLLRVRMMDTWRDNFFWFGDINFTALELKYLISEATGVPTHVQRLLFWRLELPDHAVLADVGCALGSTIHMTTLERADKSSEM